jgi:hypothetical protein
MSLEEHVEIVNGGIMEVGVVVPDWQMQQEL